MVMLNNETQEGNMQNWINKVFSWVKNTTSEQDTVKTEAAQTYRKGDLVRVSWGANRGQIGRILRIGKITDSVYVEFDGVHPGYWVDITFVMRVDTLAG